MFSMKPCSGAKGSGLEYEDYASPDMMDGVQGWGGVGLLKGMFEEALLDGGEGDQQLEPLGVDPLEMTEVTRGFMWSGNKLKLPLLFMLYSLSISIIVYTVCCRLGFGQRCCRLGFGQRSLLTTYENFKKAMYEYEYIFSASGWSELCPRIL